MKPFAPACERNQDVILEVLKEAFASCGSVLEIGSGTGQHAVYFGRHLPHLTWLPGDLESMHAGINMWLAEAQLENVRPPIVLDVDEPVWPVSAVDGVFSANVLHIVSWEQGKNLIAGAARVLNPGGVLCVYGPFNYNGDFTSPSNARFELWLKGRDPQSGIRDFEKVRDTALEHGLVLDKDYTMPANNRILTFRKK